MLLAFTFATVVVVASVEAVFDGRVETKSPTKRQPYTPMQCSSSSGAYSYDKNAANGPENWSILSECCGGQMQSPIDMITSKARCGQIFPFYYGIFPFGRLSGKLYNSGLSPKLKFASTATQRATLSDVPYSSLSEYYILSEMHVHVGNNRPGSGSEHRIDGKGYDGEVHMIHYNAKYGSVDAALTKPDGLAVIGVFLQQSSVSPNPELNRFIDGVSRLGSTIGKKIDFSLDPRELVPRNGKFYTYQGSLTTPPCSESVRWIVMTSPISTTAEKLNVLKMLPTDKGAATSTHTNVRPSFDQGTRTLDCYE